jgi:hypothetical protein
VRLTPAVQMKRGGELVSLDEWTKMARCPKCGNVASASLNQDMSDDTSRCCLRKGLAPVHREVHISSITGSALSVGVGG